MQNYFLASNSSVSHRYDLKSDRWQQCKAMTTILKNAVAVTVNENTSECDNAIGMEWNKTYILSIQRDLEEVLNCQAVSRRYSPILFTPSAAAPNSTLATVERYEPYKTNVWAAIPARAAKRERPLQSDLITATTILNSNNYIICGSKKCNSRGTGNATRKRRVGWRKWRQHKK